VDHDKVRSSLSAYKDGELEEGLRERIFRHLRSCDACRGELRNLEQIDTLVRGLPEISASETFVSETMAKTSAAEPLRHLKPSLPQRIAQRFLLLANSIFELLPGYEFQRTGSLDEFGDFPPLSLGHAYCRLIGRQQGGQDWC
jgi:anti-sigma factor RsiW